MPLDKRFLGEDAPALREDGDGRHQYLPGRCCPFCDAEMLTVATGDLGERERMDLRCDNPGCEVREFVVLAMHTSDGPWRADVAALRAVDHGTPEEQERELLGLDDEDADADARLELRRERRQRLTSVVVESFERDPR